MHSAFCAFFRLCRKNSTAQASTAAAMIDSPLPPIIITTEKTTGASAPIRLEKKPSMPSVRENPIRCDRGRWYT